MIAVSHVVGVVVHRTSPDSDAAPSSPARRPRSPRRSSRSLVRRARASRTARSGGRRSVGISVSNTRRDRRRGTAPRLAACAGMSSRRVRAAAAAGARGSRSRRAARARSSAVAVSNTSLSRPASRIAQAALFALGLAEVGAQHLHAAALRVHVASSSDASRRRSEMRRASNTDAALSICSRVGLRLDALPARGLDLLRRRPSPRAPRG